MGGGIKVFSSLEEAQAAGFLPYEKTDDGYLVRKDDGHAFALAVVKFEPKAGEEAPEPKPEEGERATAP